MRVTDWRRSVVAFRSACVVLLFATLTWVSLPSGQSWPSEAAAPRSLLTWAPPAGWENYTPITVPLSGGVITFPRNDTDYRIVAPWVVRGPVILRGGRNVVWIGGHIQIDRDDALKKDIAISAPDRRGILIDDGQAPGVAAGRVVFIEGIRLDGNDLSEGVDIKAPNAHIYLQNIGIDTVRHRGFDDRDSTGPYSKNLPTKGHPDLVEPFGGFLSLNIDGLSGSTNYQGLFLSTHVAPTPGTGGDIRLRRIDMAAVELPDDVPGFRHAGHMGIVWYGDQIGQIFIDPGTVWFQHHVNSGWGDVPGFRRVAYRDAAGVIHLEAVPGNSDFVDNFGAGSAFPNTTRDYPYGAIAGSDATGAFVTWSEAAVLEDGRPAVRDWAGASQGRVYSGTPPHGSYVPVDSVGLEYDSPGYEGGK